MNRKLRVLKKEEDSSSATYEPSVRLETGAQGKKFLVVYIPFEVIPTPVLVPAVRGLPISVPPEGLLRPREKEVFTLVATGKTAKEVALILHISHRTVKFHVGNVYRKLGLRGGRADLLRMYGTYLQKETDNVV